LGTRGKCWSIILYRQENAAKTVSEEMWRNLEKSGEIFRKKHFSDCIRVWRRTMERRMEIEIEDVMSIREFSDKMGFSDSKVRRLIKHGCEAIDGRIVRLETIITEAGIKISPNAYKNFLRALNTNKGEGLE